MKRSRQETHDNQEVKTTSYRRRLGREGKRQYAVKCCAKPGGTSREGDGTRSAKARGPVAGDENGTPPRDCIKRTWSGEEGPHVRAVLVGRHDDDLVRLGGAFNADDLCRSWGSAKGLHPQKRSIEARVLGQ